MTHKPLEEEVAIVDEWLRTYACFQDGIDDVDFILRLIADWRARGEEVKRVRAQALADRAFQTENAALRARIAELERQAQDRDEIHKKAVYCAEHHCDCDQANDVRTLLEKRLAARSKGEKEP